VLRSPRWLDAVSVDVLLSEVIGVFLVWETSARLRHALLRTLQSKEDRLTVRAAFRVHARKSRVYGTIACLIWPPDNLGTPTR
jgi:hypothetical protein